MKQRTFTLLTSGLGFLLSLSMMISTTYALFFNHYELGSGIVLGFLEVDARIYQEVDGEWEESFGTTISITDPLIPNDFVTFKITITNSGTISAFYDISFKNITSCVPGYPGWCYDGYVQEREGFTYYPMREVLRFFVSTEPESFLIGATGDVIIADNVRLDPGETGEVIIQMVYDEEQGSELSARLNLAVEDLYYLDFNALIDIYMQQI